MKKIFLLINLLLVGILMACNNQVTEDNDAYASKIIDSLNVDVHDKVVELNFNLPKEVVYEDNSYLITWESSNTAVLTFIEQDSSYLGKINRQNTDVQVTFTASISYKDVTKSKEFSLTIAKLDSGNTDTPIDPNPDTPGDLPSDITYTGYYADMTGMFDTYDDFFTTLNDILVTTHTKHLTYKEVWTVLQESDEYDEDNILCFYTGQALAKEARDGSGNTDGGLVWNREHVWAKSHGFNSESFTAYGDAHHLRATEKTINSSRNNSYFDELGTSGNSDEFGNRWTSDVFEPRDEVKGDVARILFYMVTRYHDSTLTLTLDNSGNYPSQNGVGSLGMLDTLVKWHYEDPVSETEIKRNEVVYSYQGNRNPYIDHPEFVYYLYEDESKALGISEENVLEKVENGSTSNPDENLEITQLITDIEALRDKDITLEDKSLLDSLKQRYDALTPADKTKISNYDLLQAKFREYDLLIGKESIVYDLMQFPSTGSSYSKSPLSQEINGVTFYASNYSTKDKEFLLGANTKSYVAPDTKYNVGNWSKFSVLVFKVNDLISLSFDVGNINSGFNGAHLIYSTDDITYTLVDDLSCVTGENTFYNFVDGQSGYFGIVVEGSQARVILMNFTLTYKKI